MEKIVESEIWKTTKSSCNGKERKGVRKVCTAVKLGTSGRKGLGRYGDGIRREEEWEKFDEGETRRLSNKSRRRVRPDWLTPSATASFVLHVRSWHQTFDWQHPVLHM